MATNKISTISFNVDVAPKAHDMGRNLLRGAGLTSLDSITDGGIALYRINSLSESLVKIVDGVDGNKGVWVKTNSGETNIYRGAFFIAAVNKGETYTLSAWVKGTAGTTLYLEVLNSIGTARKNSDGTDSTRYTGTGSFATITDDWRRVTFTFTVDDLNGGYVECNLFTNAVGEFTICEPKLERGDVATAFCLNEADLKGDKGDKGDTPTIAKLRVDHSALHYNPTTKKWDYDSVTVTIVIFTPEGTRTPGNNDISEYYWLLDNVSIKRASGNGFSATLEVASHTATLYKVGSNVAIDSITVPMVRDGHDGIDGESVSGADAVVYTIEAVGSSNNNSGTLTDDAKSIAVTLIGNLKLYKTVGSEKTEATKTPQCWRMTIGGTNVDGTSAFSYSAGNNIVTYSYSQNYLIDDKGKCDVPGSATISVYKDNTLSEMIASLVIPITLNPNAIVDVNTQLGTINSTTASMKETVDGMQGTIETIQQGQGQINLKVQDLQNGGIDTGKPHTSSQVDFTTLSADNFYPVMIKLKDDDGVRHTVEIDRPLNAAYGSGKGYMTHPGDGFSFRLVFSDIANGWGSYEDGQLRIESISQYWTTPADTPICPKIEQYYPFSFIVAWLRGGSKYDITVDCTDAYVSGIWPYMMQMKSNPSWVPDVVRLAPYTWTTDQVNAQGGNPYNLLQHDSGGFYADTDKEYLYRFGEMIAGNTFAIVGQPKDSKQWFVATWKIASVSGSKVYVDTSTYGILWQTQNPLGIRMNGVLGYIKKGVSYSKSTWDSEQGFGTSESLDNTAVHANWVASRPILVIGKESSAINGVYRDRAVLENVDSCSEEDSVFFHSGTYFDVSPLYGTDGRTNVKTDLLATGIDIKSHKIEMTADNFTLKNNKKEVVFGTDADKNIFVTGTIRANNFFRKVCVWNYFKHAYYFKDGVYYSEQEVEDKDLVTDDMIVNSGPADLVIVPFYSKEATERVVCLPDANDYEGKIIEVVDTDNNTNVDLIVKAVNKLTSSAAGHFFGSVSYSMDGGGKITHGTDVQDINVGRGKTTHFYSLRLDETPSEAAGTGLTSYCYWLLLKN